MKTRLRLKKGKMLVFLGVIIGLLLAFSVVYAALGTTYAHWADVDVEWQSNIVSDGKSDYAEVEVIPHFFAMDGFETGKKYYFNIEYDYFQNNTKACGFYRFNTWDLDRLPPPDPPVYAGHWQAGEFATVPFDLEVGIGDLYVANATVEAIIGPVDTDPAYPLRYVQIAFTPTDVTLPAEFYWGLQIGYSGQCGPESIGATSWTGGSLQTTIVCTDEIPPYTYTVPGPPTSIVEAECKGAGKLQADPSGIRPTAITGYKWFDTNGNGIWDARIGHTCTNPPADGCEYPLPSWEIQAFLCPDTTCDTWGTAVVVSDTTNAQGQYTLSGLEVGSTYRACEVIDQNNLPAIWYQTNNITIQNGCSPTVTVVASGGGVLTTRRDFGNWMGETAVNLNSFEANPENKAIKVEWTTSMERDTLGYNLYRSRNKNEKRMEFIDYIPVEFDGVYEYSDADVRPGKKYYYWLEADYGNSTEVFGPIGPVRAPK